MLLRKKTNQCGLPNLTRTSKIPEASGNSRNANASKNLIVFASLEEFTYHFSVFQCLNTNGILFRTDPNFTMQPAQSVAPELRQ
jgi:hypothetical protein